MKALPKEIESALRPVETELTALYQARDPEAIPIKLEHLRVAIHWALYQAKLGCTSS